MQNARPLHGGELRPALHAATDVDRVPRGAAEEQTALKRRTSRASRRLSRWVVYGCFGKGGERAGERVVRATCDGGAAGS